MIILNYCWYNVNVLMVKYMVRGDILSCIYVHVYHIDIYLPNMIMILCHPSNLLLNPPYEGLVQDKIIRTHVYKGRNRKMREIRHEVLEMIDFMFSPL